ncbi:hypothetical protein F0L74_29555 [Chitinophaga agrisoli]|uniref:Apea-like HEPN domain-containing protein n=1 Tax=Chitinophaga agrisoli TaxID=2607653 RepID=A0A5B2VNP7_9BACT|nr:HEPN domain-containing protein [Chitinophaga agrisoli]KAA2240310.1 hypothetical protein F0L74_29555 [Chitinophaga agrisoli]
MQYVELDASIVTASSGNLIAQSIYVRNYTLRRKKKIDRTLLTAKNMLLSGWTSSRQEINEVIIKWFKNERFYNIYEYYLDSNNWFQGSDAKLSNVMFNNRFLNLIQGLEDYYRERFEIILTAEDRKKFDEKKKAILDQIPPSPLKQWLNNTFKFTKYPKLEEKLLTIVNELESDLDKLFANISLANFPQTAASFRNNLSHGMTKELNQGLSFYKDYFTAQTLLGICILKTLGVTKLKDKAAYYSKFEDAAYEIYSIQEKERK